MKSRRVPAWIPGTLVLGIVLSFGVFAIVRHYIQLDLQTRASDVVEEQIEKLRVSMLRSTEVLYSIASLYSTEGRIDGAQFSRFVQQGLSRQPELLALSWNPVVPGNERTEFESKLGVPIREKRGGGEMVRAGDRPVFVPVGLIEPLDGNAAALGYDLSSDELRGQSLVRARDTGKAIGTAALRLAQDPKSHSGFLVMLPVYRVGANPQTLAERREKIAGYAVAVFRVANLVGSVFDELKRKGVEVELRDISAKGELIHSTSPASISPFGVTELEFAEHRWEVMYAPTTKFGGNVGGYQAWMVLLGGLAFTAMTTAYLWAGWRRVEEAAAANVALQVEVGERKRAEALAAAANDAKSDFLASMSHEIRTPLNAILGYAQLMGRDPHLAPDQRDSVAGIGASGRHMLGLINAVLDLAKIEAGRMELNPIDFDVDCFAQSVASTIRPLCSQKRIGFRMSISGPGKKRMRGDEGKLRQIIINLLGNAVKFTPRGEVFLGIAHEGNEMWRFEVVDTGMGIPDEERDGIFEPFHQGKGAQHQGGTGLGLAIARRQVELMGGSLAFESERGMGTRFYFSISLPEASGLEIVEESSDPSEHSMAQVPLVQVDLPQELAGRLMIAAELHSATALKGCLKDLRELGGGSAQLADTIGQLMRSYNMDAIQRLLAQVAGGGAGELHHEISHR